jgi:hypothetical protein
VNVRFGQALMQNSRFYVIKMTENQNTLQIQEQKVAKLKVELAEIKKPTKLMTLKERQNYARKLQETVKEFKILVTMLLIKKKIVESDIK